MTTVRCPALARARRLKWYVEAEKTNGRWAMMAVAGILGQELLGVDAKWYEAGAKEYDLPVIAQLPIFFLVMGFLETKRFQGFKETGTVSGSSAITLAARRQFSSSAAAAAMVALAGQRHRHGSRLHVLVQGLIFAASAL